MRSGRQTIGPQQPRVAARGIDPPQAHECCMKTNKNAHNAVGEGGGTGATPWAQAMSPISAAFAVPGLPLGSPRLLARTSTSQTTLCGTPLEPDPPPHRCCARAPRPPRCGGGKHRQEHMGEADARVMLLRRGARRGAGPQSVHCSALMESSVGVLIYTAGGPPHGKAG